MHRRHESVTSLLLVLLALLSVACEETDVVAIRVHLDDPTGGTVVVNSLQAPQAQGPVETATQGVDWEQRMNLVCASGRFGDISKLRVKDIEFGGGSTTEGAGFVQIRLPRGPTAQWPSLMADAAPDQLLQAGRILQPPGGVRLGRTLKIKLELPGAVVTQGVRPRIHQIKTATSNLGHEKDRAKAKNRVATLVVPLELAREGSGDVVWHVMWQR